MGTPFLHAWEIYDEMVICRASQEIGHLEIGMMVRRANASHHAREGG